ncbi:hypothetical protein EJ04DRAFT_497847 [Polyplosphaeria fusca]|uniref:Zn(2)-C6 fungal-type domain-containing protein n=1 Tax=Polyplosphaeria fusca TaxID=682080 RepID=A0A9P4QV38_9PLEO|nr:hypothetical protein EJ04DRAFT_497847 [Polyplosphaeria fusca]
MSSGLERRRAPRSCYSCNNRKIRCDKKQPCSCCTKAGRACEFPPRGPRHRRTKATIIADMASRLASLEKSLENSEISTLTSPTHSSHRTCDPGSEASAPSKEEVLYQKGSSTQYFNDILSSRVIQERRIQSLPTPDSPQPKHAPDISPFSALGILSSPSSSMLPSSLHPSKQIAVRLWNVYVSKVAGASVIKILHIPTDELKVYTTIDDTTTSPFDYIALNFAIYFISTTALDEDEASFILGQHKTTALVQFKSALRVNNRDKGIWILNGLLIRMAESLGLHRDGKQLGLSPFESELRRRLWWHILSRDGRAGEDHGLENHSLSLVSKVELPRNLDDEDIHPQLTELPTSKEGWTSMTDQLITIDIVRSSQKLAVIAAAASPSSPPSESVRQHIVTETKNRVETYLAHCNPIVPHQRLTLLLARLLLRKLDFVTRLQWILVQRPATGSPANFATEENLIDALAILEPKMFVYDEFLRHYSWACRGYPQYHATMYILWHLCVLPEGPNVDKAWEFIDDAFNNDDEKHSMKNFGSKSAVLADLRAKALAIRHGTQGFGLDAQAVVDDQHARGAPTRTEAVACALPTPLSGFEQPAFADGTDWLDWEALAQGFQTNSPATLWA